MTEGKRAKLPPALYEIGRAVARNMPSFTLCCRVMVGFFLEADLRRFSELANLAGLSYNPVVFSGKTASLLVESGEV
jgi:hypothetical protein